MKLNLPKEREYVGTAPLWKRIAAFFIDLFIINFVLLIPFRPLLRVLVQEESGFSQMYSYLSSNPSVVEIITAVSLT
ncbi:RDD family protein, partial [candidate division KSB1 bacterium]|nr:RDD family protein [candidate division KSB1 bacterium]